MPHGRKAWLTKMKKIKQLSEAANKLRERFQKEVVVPYVKQNGGIRGFSGQIYILLNREWGGTKVSKTPAYKELYNYLSYTQSQRRFQQVGFTNGLIEVKRFMDYPIDSAFSRVWHNGTTVYSGEHWKAQAEALRRGISKHGFTHYPRDYNFQDYLYGELMKANPLLVSIYEKIIAAKVLLRQLAA